MLRSAGWLYGKIADARNALYDGGIFRSHSLGARTISIGNITTGGTGKTPLVAYVAEILADTGEKVCILTRGYGRQDPRNRVLVSDGKNVLVNARTGGDEPVELARKLIGKAIVVADADRVAAAKWAKEKFGITAFVLDDGFQHRRAKRDLDIVCIDAMNPGATMLPAGTLREPLKNLARADVVILTRSDLVTVQMSRFAESLSKLVEFEPTTKERLDEWYAKADRFKNDHLLSSSVSWYVPHALWHYLSDADIRIKDETYAKTQREQMNSLLKDLKQPVEEIKKEIGKHGSGARILVSRIEIVGLRTLSDFESNEKSWKDFGAGTADQRRILAFCALGNPEAFFAQLSLGSSAAFDPSLTCTFPDHHRYSQSDISMLEEKARNAGAKALLTTEKDAVKLGGLTFDLPCYVVGIEVKLDDPDGFRDLIISS